MSSVEMEVKDIMARYNEEVRQAIERDAKEVSKECAEKLKSSSPVDTGKYAKGWTYKKQGETYIVHNRHYQLTHLLENGHISKNQYGTYDRVDGITHIAPVEDWGCEEFEKRVKEDIAYANI